MLRIERWTFGDDKVEEILKENVRDEYATKFESTSKPTIRPISQYDAPTTCSHYDKRPTVFI